MHQLEATLTVYFEEPFWVGVYERREAGRLQVNRVVFGAQPKEGEVYAYYLAHWRQLRFSPPVAAGERPRPGGNPKRLQRAIRRQMAERGVGTKAQQALKLQQEQGRTARRATARAEALQQKERAFALRRQKHKEKHKGR